jgi:membrane protein DedA with SNARE-associated domain/membrane-associated phospholipid phosphatase
MFDFLLELKPWIAWLHLHPYWVWIVTFGISFIECVAVIGVLVPGLVLITAVSSLAGSGVVPLQMVLIPAILGAILGDALSFMIGYHFHERIRDIWPFKFYPSLLQRGESFFYRHGGKSILVARFIGPIRPMAPLVAGMLNMQPWRFAVANTVSAIVWAPLYMLPGFLLGKTSVVLPPDIAMDLMLYVIFTLLILWLISWLIKRFIVWVFTTIHNALDRLWMVIKDKPFLRPLHIALQDPLHPESHAQLTLGLYVLFMGSLFGWVVWNVVHHGILTVWNRPIAFFLRTLRGPIADNVFMILTILGEPKVILGVFIIITLWLLSIRAWRTISYWGLLGLFSFGGTEFLKHIIHSPRPWGLWETPSGYSFPSGHTTLTATITGFVAVLIARELKPPLRWIPYTLIPILVLAISTSRLYLGAHWLTDVVGGLLLGITIVMFVTLIYCKKETPKLNPVWLSFIFILSWACVASVYSLKYYPKMTKNYSVYVPEKVLSLKEWWDHEGIDEPLFRMNRTGKPGQILNVQWASDLEDIQQNLMTKGWRVSPNTTFGLILNRVNKQTKNIELPILLPLYLDQRPSLVMTKTIDSSQNILILSLWDSKTGFQDAEIPLWLGTIMYYPISETGLFRLPKSKINLHAVPAIKILENDVSDFDWKQLSYSLLASRVSTQLEWDGQIVLIRPKDEEIS